MLENFMLFTMMNTMKGAGMRIPKSKYTHNDKGNCVTLWFHESGEQEVSSSPDNQAMRIISQKETNSGSNSRNWTGL